MPNITIIEAAEKAIDTIHDMSDEQVIEALDTCGCAITYAVYPDGVPCEHRGCLNHVTHPCEVCGRIAGHRQYINFETK